MRRRSSSPLRSRWRALSNIVAPGTSSTPPTTTRPGSPAACRSTAWSILAGRIDPLLCRIFESPSASPVALARLGHLAVHVPLRVTIRDLATTVPRLLAARQPQLHLRPAAREVDRQGHDRQALGLGLAQELVDLAAMQQQLPGALGLVVEADIRRPPRGDVQADDPGLVTLDARVGIREAHLVIADALDLGAAQHDACLEGVLDAVVVMGSSVPGDRVAHRGTPLGGVGRQCRTSDADRRTHERRPVAGPAFICYRPPVGIATRRRSPTRWCSN